MLCMHGIVLFSRRGFGSWVTNGRGAHLHERGGKKEEEEGRMTMHACMYICMNTKKRKGGAPHLPSCE